MLSRTFTHAALGLLLSGCTVTNNLSTSINHSADTTVTYTSSGSPEAVGITGFVNKTLDSTPAKKAEKVRPVESKPVHPQQPIQTQPQSKSAYCDHYEPLAVPDPIEVDDEVYNKAMATQNEVAVRQVLTKNIIDINIQYKDYRKNLKKHHAQWMKACSK